MKADLKDGFARVSVTLLHAWALLKHSGCAKSCLLILVADTWGVSLKKPGYLSSLSRYQLFSRLKSAFSRSTVNSAIESLLKDELIFIDSATKKIGLIPEVLESKSPEFQAEVLELNRTRRRVHTSGISDKPENRTSGIQDSNTGKQDGNTEIPDAPIEDTHAKKRFEEEESSSAFPHEKLTREQAIECLPKIANEFIEIMHSKLFFSRAKTFEAVKAVSAPFPKLVCAIAAVFVAVVHGAKPRNITGTIADAVHNPHNWPLVDPIDMTDKLLAKRKADEGKLADYDRQRKLENEAYQHGLKEQRRRDKERHELAKFRREYALAEKEAHDENFRRDNPEIVADHERKLAAAIRANKGLPPLNPEPEHTSQDPEKPEGT